MLMHFIFPIVLSLSLPQMMFYPSFFALPRVLPNSFLTVALNPEYRSRRLYWGPPSHYISCDPSYGTPPLVVPSLGNIRCSPTSPPLKSTSWGRISSTRLEGDPLSVACGQQLLFSGRDEHNHLHEAFTLVSPDRKSIWLLPMKCAIKILGYLNNMFKCLANLIFYYFFNKKGWYFGFQVCSSSVLVQPGDSSRHMDYL